MSDPIEPADVVAALTPAWIIHRIVPDEGVAAAWVLVLVEGVRARGLNPITKDEIGPAVQRHLLGSRFPPTPHDIWMQVREARIQEVARAAEHALIAASAVTEGQLRMLDDLPGGTL